MWRADEVWLLFCGGLATVGVVLVSRVALRRSSREGGFPPGPVGWPLVGNWGVFKEYPHQKLRELSRVYGPIVGLRLGQQQAVVVCSPALAKQVLLTHDRVFANRPPLAFTSELLLGNDILHSASSPHWRKLRKVCMVELFTSKRLRSLEYVRQEELSLLLCRLRDLSADGTLPADIGRCVGLMSCSLISRLLYSKAGTHVAGEDLQELIREAEQESLPTVGDLIPWLSLLDFSRKRRMRGLRARLEKVVNTILAERKGSTSEHDDFLQALLSKEVLPDHASQEALTELDIKVIMMDMFAAGIHTTPLTLEWAMAELLRNPRCLGRLQEDIDTVLGGKRRVTESDLANLPYLKWVVKEVFRLHSVAPLLLPRISSEECKLDGYTLPANTLAFVNIWAIGRDEQLWSVNANEFLPERFEGAEIDVKGQHFEVLPFGAGRRICLGLPLGLASVEVTLANLVSNFNWELPPGQAHASIDMREKPGLTLNRASPVLAIPKPR